MKPARASMALLAIQLVLVSSIAAKFLIDRSHNPHAWARAVVYDPESIMRGRYLSIPLYADACSLPASQTRTDVANANNVPGYLDMADGSTFLQGKVGVRNGRLSVLQIERTKTDSGDQALIWPQSGNCDEVELWTPVDLYLSETAKSPFPLQKGQDLWVQVTVPPSGPPRPISLAIQSADGKWQPLNFR